MNMGEEVSHLKAHVNTFYNNGALQRASEQPHLKTNQKPSQINKKVGSQEIKRGGQVGTAKVWVKQTDDLFIKSGEIELYREGYIVQNIDCTPDVEYIEFNQGRLLEPGQEMGGMGDDIMKAQVFETVEQHLKKERSLNGKGIKVLSLFFIDKVSRTF
ncbi:hypothetical protein [Ruegeria sp.]|uniref:hypothetical protein n=1 Tax=Ruegeria sp. TaxID=1879320 RepID=UPI003B008DC3